MTAEHLTDAEIASLQDVRPGEAPGELAQHLASCESCQARALFGAGRRPGKREPAQLPSLGRTLGLLALLIFAMAAFFWTLRRLAGGE